MLTGFNWILPKRLAGSGRPGLLADLEEDVAFLRGEGISTIVTLTEELVSGLVDGCIGHAGHAAFEIIHFPIPDMGFPTPRACAVVCRDIITRMERSAVLVHCRAGLGRTGTIAACCLVVMGEEPARALQRVRAINPRYVQTPAQEQFIGHFARYVCGE